MKERLMQHWNKLQEREQKMLAIAGIFLVFLLLYLAMQAGSTRMSELKQNVAREQQLLDWMPNAVEQVLLSRTQQSGEPITPANLLAQVERSLADAGLSGQLVTLNLIANNEVQLEFNDVVYEALIAWLYAISKQGVVVKEFIATKADAVGAVQASVSLSAAG